MFRIQRLSVQNFKNHFDATFGLLGNTLDLAQYAEVFLKNHINGRRLLRLTQNDLRAMGISSVGHIMDLFVSFSGFFLSFWGGGEGEC